MVRIRIPPALSQQRTRILGPPFPHLPKALGSPRSGEPGSGTSSRLSERQIANRFKIADQGRPGDRWLIDTVRLAWRTRILGHIERISSFSPRNSARMRCDGNLAKGSLNSLEEAD
jgi:hypothetical protein